MKFRNCCQLSLFLCVLGVATPWSADASTVSYNVTDLGKFPGGSYSSGYGINDNGQGVGGAEVPNASSIGAGSHAFLYSGAML